MLLKNHAKDNTGTFECIIYKSLKTGYNKKIEKGVWLIETSLLLYIVVLIIKLCPLRYLLVVWKLFSRVNYLIFSKNIICFEKKKYSILFVNKHRHYYLGLDLDVPSTE